MAKQYVNRTHDELVAEITELKKVLRRKDSALNRIEGYAKSGNISACKAAAGNALRAQR